MLVLVACVLSLSQRQIQMRICEVREFPEEGVGSPIQLALAYPIWWGERDV